MTEENKEDQELIQYLIDENKKLADKIMNLNSVYLVRISFLPAYYYAIEENQYLMKYLFDNTVLSEYKHYCCPIRNAELSCLDYWICFKEVYYQDLLEVVEIIKDLGIICKVEYCDDDDNNLNYKIFFEN